MPEAPSVARPTPNKSITFVVDNDAFPFDVRKPPPSTKHSRASDSRHHQRWSSLRTKNKTNVKFQCSEIPIRVELMPKDRIISDLAIQ
ncbi:hypothetical protein N7491_005858 [Penicillium cf. griseofulvum]|uniref:Uncharacterized protein n=1 Tax=Penicillium cf. griseofulvum TaxID=2972120 RepID=A0A9W9J4D3_9EURO|nr:hypothetical protein N7472_008543 [Penicillium cf. griseofulvum]KAJ5435263.1 hypothetical protein N7491_005858 [Penicillium cf. griseofulvum]KAJ5453097.1 hypothetical protein N7445_001280 [Penicillium cf. griseofulvum]